MSLDWSTQKVKYFTENPDSLWVKYNEGTPEEYEEFLQKLNFEYDAGYGGQELHGMIWLKEENTWMERGEYDGSEWWEYRKCPKVPDELKAN